MVSLSLDGSSVEEREGGKFSAGSCVCYTVTKRYRQDEGHSAKVRVKEARKQADEQEEKTKTIPIRSNNFPLILPKLPIAASISGAFGTSLSPKIAPGLRIIACSNPNPRIASSTPTFILLYGTYPLRSPLVPPLETKTYVLTPASFAAFAFSMQRSWSIFHWAWRPPAAALVVPMALKMTEMGLGPEIMEAHFDVSGSRIASSFVDCGLGRRREMVLMELKSSLERRVFRMLLPTAPVEPNTAAVVISAWGFVKTPDL